MKFFYCVLLLPGLVLADATIPTKDLSGAKEPAVLGRYEGSFIVESQAKSYDALSLPLSALIAVGDDKTDSHNNSLYAAKQKLSLEGKLLRAAYVLPAERSPLEVLRNYQQVLRDKNGAILYECAGDECGGDATAGAEHGGGRTALIDSVYPVNAVTSANFSNGNCAINAGHVDQRFFVGKLDNAGIEIHVAVLTYTVRDELYCKALNERTVALVVTLEAKAREQKMVAVKASELAQSINATGKIALYGIYFDLDKAELKPESKPQVDEIAALLKADPALKLIVVGHTDNQGAAAHNIELSKKRAEAVAAGLQTQYGIAADRLLAQGMGSAAPVASNDSDTGRAKNRRVELVKQ